MDRLRPAGAKVLTPGERTVPVMIETEILRVVGPDEVADLDRRPVDGRILEEARSIVQAVRNGGDEALRDFAIQYDGLAPDDPLLLERPALEAAHASLDGDDRAVLDATAGRIRSFAEAQRACLDDLEVDVPGGRAGHAVRPLERAGCYAPGGGYPLPSSVLMTAVTARVAGVEEVLVASPDPATVTLAAAHAAGADRVLTAGGAQAMGAMGFGTGSIAPCDVVVGPGGPWVTAGKKAISGYVRTDFMAGPTELVILADGSADPGTVAADLIAQAEHAPEALAILVTPDDALLAATDAALVEQLADLPTAGVARQAFETGFAVAVDDLEAGVAVCDELAPEHLQLMGGEARAVAAAIDRYGALFIGEATAEAFGDYGVGPNHVLPTGGAARFTGGLSVFEFLRLPTWLEMTDDAVPAELRRDVPTLARLEGLEGHARSAERRFGDG